MRKRGAKPKPNIVLDTSAYARFREGNEEVAEWLAVADTVALPMMVLGELEAGFVLGSRTEENRVTLDDFLAEPFVQVLAVSRETATRYGALFAALRRKGTPVGTNDIWIAAAAIDSARHLLTFDGDFDHIPGLDVTVLEAPASPRRRR